MWIFCKAGFFSVVKDARDASNVQVRTRSRTDIETFARAFTVGYTANNKLESKSLKIIETPNADYPFRVIVRHDDLGAWLHSAAMAINYTNFKASVPKRARAYHDVWDVMREAFEGERP